MRRRDDGAVAANVLAQVMHALNLIADAHATPAEDALFRIAHHGMAGILHRKALALTFEQSLAHAQRIGEVLQFAAPIAFAGLALARVVVQQQFHDIASRLANLRGIGAHHHPFGNLRAARGHEKGAVFDLDEADAARPCRLRSG